MADYGSKTRCESVERYDGKGTTAGKAFCDGYLNWLIDNGLNAKADAKLSNVTYWKCLTFYNTDLSAGSVPETNNGVYRCTSHNINAYYNKNKGSNPAKSKNYSNGTDCSNYKATYDFAHDSDDFTIILLNTINLDKDTSKSITYNPTTKTIANKLTELYNKIVQLIENKKLNYKFSNITVDYSTLDKPNENTEIRTKILNDLYTTMKKFEKADTITTLPAIPSNIATGKQVNASDITAYNTIANIFIQDCVCYSDCNGYSVCYCYGNCNHY